MGGPPCSRGDVCYAAGSGGLRGRCLEDSDQQGGPAPQASLESGLSLTLKISRSEMCSKGGGRGSVAAVFKPDF